VQFRNRSDKNRGVFLTGLFDAEFMSFRVKAFLNGVNVSDDIFTDRLKLAGITAGGLTPRVRIDVKMRQSAGDLDQLGLSIRGTYNNDSYICGDGPSILAGFIS
jgi:hypothetical protein